MFSNKRLILFIWIILSAAVLLSAGKGKQNKNKNASKANTVTISSAEKSNLPQLPANSFVEITINLTKDVFHQSYKAFHKIPVKDLKKKHLKVQFRDKIGTNITNMVKEWFALISTQFITTQLFLYPSNDKSLGIQMIDYRHKEDQLSKLEFIGKISALAIHHNHRFSECFCTPMLKAILNQTIDIEEIRFIKPSLYGMQFLNVTPDTVITINDDPNKQPIIITSETELMEYIRLMVEYCYGRSSKSMQAFLKGFNAILPDELVKMFSITELNAMLCGVPITKKKEIWDIFKTKIFFEGFSDGVSVMNMFWKILEEFDNKQLSQLLKIMTSLPRLPKGGPAKLSPIIIRKDQDSKIMGTPGNIVLMPEYDNEDQMAKKLKLAVKNADNHIKYLQSVSRKFIQTPSKGQK